MKLPYGIADFPRLIRDGYVYVDRTRFIAVSEDYGPSLLFVRPRRFGKTLWLQTLATWYDLRYAERHDELFGHLDAGREGPSSAHRYFVMTWNFSKIPTPASGLVKSVGEMGERLEDYITGTIEAFLIDYARWLPEPVVIEDHPIRTLGKLLAVVRRTPYPLCLLIDEYDNFANEIMMTDPGAYQRLVKADGPFKHIMKWVKAATEGEGIERLFFTGVTPVVLSDLTSSINIAKNVSLLEDFAQLCGFTEDEVRGLVRQILAERRTAGKTTHISVDDAVDMMRTWYNGYRFAPPTPADQPRGASPADEAIYNPTLTLHFLDHLQRKGGYPRQMLDANLAADENKLRFLARRTEGYDLLAEIVQTGKPLEVDNLADRFTLADMLTQPSHDRVAVASFLVYFGMLTIKQQTPQFELHLAPPNLVIRKLYVDQLLRLLLEEEPGAQDLGKPARELILSGEIEPLLRLMEEQFLPLFSKRDSRWMNELAVKTAFMALLFRDVNYTLHSEPHTGGGFADLVLLLRPDARQRGLFDLLFEFKYIKPDTLGEAAARLDVLGPAELAELPAVSGALAEATAQARRYGAGLIERFGARTLRLRSWVVVVIGFRRLVARAVDGEKAGRGRPT